jgi:hypothetical protein
MRIGSDVGQLLAEPGSTTAFTVDVVNTGQVIDGVTARVIGLPAEQVRTEPALLPLFPDASGRLRLSVAVPPAYPAGIHPLTVEVLSHGAQAPPQYLDLTLDVSARPAMSLLPRPRVIRARREGRFVLELANRGNVPLEISFQGRDVERNVEVNFAPRTVRVEPGSVVPVLLTVRGPRMTFGAELERAVTVLATPRRLDTSFPGLAPTRADAAEEPDDIGFEPLGEPEEPHETTVRLRQRPLISRGLLTILILASILALWAGVFLLGITKVFTADPATKAAPASFFVGTDTGSGDGTGSGTGAVAGVAPAGALPKTGQLPPGVGGVITGTVIAKSNQQGVGRIVVDALRRTKTGLQVVSSAATQTDGTYTLAGLFPTDYYLRFSASGYRAVWYPAAPSASAAQPVTAVAQGGTGPINVTITGLPASISGTIDPGDALTPVPTKVVARALESSGTAPVAASTTSDADGKYTLTNLPAPGTYELSFTATGYEVTTIVETVGGGQQRLEPVVQLSVGPGQISGVVTDGTHPLGNVTITTVVGGKNLTVTTPTTGATGTFTLANLPTPATYVVTFHLDGYGSQTTVIDLSAGQQRSAETITLTPRTGSVSGTVVDGSGHGLGGVSVTVGGNLSTGQNPPTTTTLTNGAVGSFAISNLATPGSYTLTFSLAGYAPTTVPVTLTENGPPATVQVTMSARLGQIKGQITGPDGDPFVGATITATDGQHVWTTTSTASGPGLPSGGFLLTDLEPGTYTVTVTATNLRQQTALVVVKAGQVSTQNLQVDA